MKRTIADARRQLEQQATSINPEAYRQYVAEITKAEANVKTRAQAHVQSLLGDHNDMARATSEHLCSV